MRISLGMESEEDGGCDLWCWTDVDTKHGQERRDGIIAADRQQRHGDAEPSRTRTAHGSRSFSDLAQQSRRIACEKLCGCRVTVSTLASSSSQSIDPLAFRLNYSSNVAIELDMRVRDRFKQ